MFGEVPGGKQVQGTDVADQHDVAVKGVIADHAAQVSRMIERVLLSQRHAGGHVIDDLEISIILCRRRHHIPGCRGLLRMFKPGGRGQRPDL